ncbi:MAG: VCBS repeat-containing protein, partial [Planctomycetes bacterium]|nr:VCBS repeat-containing protein [Planctomycetota bacterium]
MMRYSITFFVVVVFTSQLAAAEPFEDATQRVGLKGLSGGVAAWGDFDRDGWVDLYVGGQLWRNEGGKRFVRFENSPPSGAGIWADFDNDGFLDLFSWEGGGRLYRNLKGKKFEHLAKAIPPLPQKVSLGAAW